MNVPSVGGQGLKESHPVASPLGGVLGRCFPSTAAPMRLARMTSAVTLTLVLPVAAVEVWREIPGDIPGV